MTTLGIQTSSYTDSTLATGSNGTVVKRVHITELRQRATSGSSSCKSISQFVQDFYQGVLHRQPSSSELTQWTDLLTQGELLATAQSLGTALFTSAEYAALNTSNSQFVTDLYAGYLSRAPDRPGYDAWMNALSNGSSRTEVRNGFAYSQEFQNDVGYLCATARMSSGIRYVLTDIQGTTRAVMNNNGSSSAVIARHDYLPFGEEIGSNVGLRSSGQGYAASDTNRWKYGMLERDAASGLDHTWWRKYESFSGRWTSPDPYGGGASIGDPQSFNRYAYTKNDPVNAVDPTGLEMSDNFCSAQFSFQDCGGWGGIYGGYFGDGYARYQQEYGGLSPEAAEGMARYNSIRTTGYDPAFDRYWGNTTITRTDAQGHVLSTQTLHNATQYQLVIAYLGAADLLRFVDGKITGYGSGSTFHVSFQFATDEISAKELKAILNNTSVFLHELLGMSFGFEHLKDVGATSLNQITDYRSINGVLGPRSLEVVINNRTLRGYADTDRFNPYQFPFGFFGHIFGEIIPHRIARIFR